MLIPGLIATFVLARLTWLQLRRKDVAPARAGLLSGFRGTALGVLAILLAQPVWIVDENQENRKAIVVLVDRSESMGLKDKDKTRYEQVLDFMREHLAPALKDQGWGVKPLLFAEDVEDANAEKLLHAKADGRRTDLGLAVSRAMNSTVTAPLAVIALTDGIATENNANGSAISSMIEAGTPFIGIGFGTDLGMSSLTLRGIEGPPVAPPNQAFRISVRIEAVTGGEMPAFDLLLLRDGKLKESRKVKAFRGARFWNEGFDVTEAEVGVHTYSVQLVAPRLEGLITRNTLEATQVRVTGEKDFRVLFVQGALSWDYKFINRAVSDDPTIRITGLSRTSKRSVFRQNLESAGELEDGFPKSLEEMAPYRVVVLSNVKPSEMSDQQQEVLARFCGELGGGVLMIGGPATFNQTWIDSRLEQLLPVKFDPDRGVIGMDQPFRFQLSEDALASPMFQVDSPSKNKEAWRKVPAFTDYGRVQRAKPGARVWAVHERDFNQDGRRILMASQFYGSGISAVLCLQNMWRWRLDKDSEPEHFDRFWKQFLRYLGEGGRQEISIQLADQDLRPDREIRFLVERRATPSAAPLKDTEDVRSYTVEAIQDGAGKPIFESKVELAAGGSISLQFKPSKEGLYQVRVQDAAGTVLVQRPVEVRDLNVEIERTARDMENLRQWAALTKGVALPVESAGNASDLVASIKSQIELAQSQRRFRWPLGMNWWVMSLVLGCLCAEWGFRKRWKLP